jgi:Mor family transcriptional regulator
MTVKNHAALPDIIVDMIQRIASLSLPPDAASREKVLLTLEKELRSTWGGDRAYIPHRRGSVDSALHSERNSRIQRAYQQGRQIAWLAKTEYLSERQVVRIVTPLRAARRPNSMG